MKKLITAICLLAIALAADTFTIVSDADAPYGSGGFTKWANWFSRKAAILDNGDVLYIRQHDYESTNCTGVYSWSLDDTTTCLYNGKDKIITPFAVSYKETPAWQITPLDGIYSALLYYVDNKPAITTIGFSSKGSLFAKELIINESNLQHAGLAASSQANGLYVSVPNYGLQALTYDQSKQIWTEKNIALNIQNDSDIATDDSGNLFFFSTDDSGSVWLSCYSPASDSTVQLYKADLSQSAGHLSVAVSQDGTTVYFTAPPLLNDPPVIYKGTYNSATGSFSATAITQSLKDIDSIDCTADGSAIVFASSRNPLDGTACGTSHIWLYNDTYMSFSCLTQLSDTSDITDISCSTPALSRNARIITFTASTSSRNQPQLCRIVRDFNIDVSNITVPTASTQDFTISANHFGLSALLKASVTTGQLLLNGKAVNPDKSIRFTDSQVLTFVSGKEDATGALTVSVSEDNGATWHTVSTTIAVSDVIFEALTIHENGSLLPPGQNASFYSIACSDDTSVTAFSTNAKYAVADTNASPNIYIRNATLGTTAYRGDFGIAQFCAISADGSTVAPYSSYFNPQSLNFDGTIQKDHAIALSHDGTLAVSFDEDGLYLTRNNEAPQRILETDVQPAHITFSLSGCDLFYTLDGSPAKLHLATGEVTPISSASYDDAIVSADGRFLFTLAGGVITRIDRFTSETLHIFTAADPGTQIIAAAADGSSLVFLTADAIVPKDFNNTTDIIRATLPVDKQPVDFNTVSAQEDTHDILPLTRLCIQDLYLCGSLASAHGTAKLTTAADGYAIDYTPAANYWGRDSFTLQAWDGSQWHGITINMTIANVNDAPVWLKESLTSTIKENQRVSTSIASFAFDQDLKAPVVPGEVLTFSLSGNVPSWITLSTKGNFVVDLTDNYSIATRDAPAVFSFTAKVTDAAGASAETPISITVTNTDPTLRLSEIYSGLQRGWNLVAYPADLPAADFFICAWGWNNATGCFEPVEILQADRGYFVLVKNIPDYSDDQKVVCDYTVQAPMTSGWHLVGHRAGTADFELNQKDMTYQIPAGALLPGKGYWKFVK